jgi:hypothetical protein
MIYVKRYCTIAVVVAFEPGFISVALAQTQTAVPTDAKYQSLQAVKNMPLPRAKLLSTNCNTNQIGCEGQTTIGGFNYDVGCTIWWNNGASGHRNFRVNAHQTVEEHVRYNDYGACVGLAYAPPKDQPRFPLHVHN